MKLLANKKIKRIVIIFVPQLILLFLIFMLCPFIILNLTESEPVGLYVKTKNKEYKKGDYVVINNNLNAFTKLAVSRGYLGKSDVFLKQIVGVSGDEIKILNGKLYINDIEIGPIYSKDGNDQPLYLMANQGKIAEDCYFLASTKINNSYDSRYFGVIKKEQLSGKVLPAITF